MIIEVKVPAAGESIATANVAQWHCRDGEVVAKGALLVTLETDKVSNELEAEDSGLLKILVSEGQEVAIGTVIATIDDSRTGESGAPAAPAADAATKPVHQDPPTVAAPPVPSAGGLTNSSEPVTPVAGSGSGSGSRIASSLSLDPAAEARAPLPPAVHEGRVTRRRMSMLRRKIASHLVTAQQTAAILTTFNEVDMSAVIDMRRQVQDEFLKKHGVKLGFMSLFLRAVCLALKDVPALNARIDGDDILENHFYDIGVAVGTEKGLVVPVVRDVDQKDLAGLEQDILEAATKAREGRLTIDDLQGGVFTISNGGVYGSLLSTPILNPPQSGILGMHTIQSRPVAVDGQVVIRPMMYLALSYDHRLVDGKEAVTFLLRVKDRIEKPVLLLREL